MNANKLSALEVRIDDIENNLKKLRAAIQNGIYDPREIVGDVTLALEGNVRQLRKILNDMNEEIPRQQ